MTKGTTEMIKYNSDCLTIVDNNKNTSKKKEKLNLKINQIT